MYVVTITRQGSSLFMWYFLYRSNNMYINQTVIGTSIFDINKKNMSRTIIFETVNLSGNTQSEHLYYHYSIKKFTVLVVPIGYWQD